MPKMLELKNAGPSAQDLLAEFEANQHKLKGVRVGSRLAVGPTEKSFTLIGTEAGLDFLPYSTGYQGAHDGLCLLYDPEQNRRIFR